ncbi:MAG: DUF2892 domain-containing protein [Mariprofundaceae bacterium]
MNANVGAIDKMVRVVVGIVLIALAMTHVWWPWGWVGLIPLGTALFSWCPVYKVFGLNTCPAEKSES